MIKETIAEGKTIEDAINIGCQTLGIDRDDAQLEILETATKGFLGLGSNAAKVKVWYEAFEDSEEKSKSFLDGLFSRAGLYPNTVVTEDDDVIKIDISGAELGNFIGRRGETLDAIQYLTSLYVNKERETHKRVSLDIENYRFKRTQTLEALARRLAQKVIKTKRNEILEPMQAYERRVIHSVLQEFGEIETHSIGFEPNRRVVIAHISNKKINNA